MPHPTDPRPALSDENAGNLTRAIQLAETLQGPVPDPALKLSELKILLNSCRAGIVQQNPRYRKHRIDALDRARNYLHFLKSMDQDDANGRLKSISRRLRSAARQN